MVVITRLNGDFRYACCNPPPVTEMRGGIFIPIDLMELLNDWEQKKPLILYNGINHYDSTISL